MLPLLFSAAVLLSSAPPQTPAGSAVIAQGREPATQAAAKAAEAYYQFMLGRHHESEGEIDLAIDAYRAASAADPASAEIRAELAGLFARQNRLREAIAEAEAALGLDAANGEARRVLGLVYAALAHPEAAASRGDRDREGYAAEAIKHLESLTQAGRSSTDPGLRLTLARLYMVTGASAKAVPLLVELIDEIGDAPELAPLLADAYAGAGRVDEAIKVLESGAAERPGLLGSLAALYERQDRWSDAAAAYEKAIAAFPRNADLRTRLAFALLNEPGRPKAARAREVLEAAVKNAPTDGRVLYLLAEAQRLTGDDKSAESTARQLMRLQPQGLSGASALAAVLSERRDYRAIVSELEPVVAGAAPDQDAGRGREFRALMTELGLAYQELGDHARAIATFDRAAPLFEGAATGAIYRTQARLAAGRFDEAIALAREARKQYPDDRRPIRLEAEALRRAGRVDEGGALLEAEVASRTGDLEARMALAEFLLSAGRLARAERLLRDTIARFPDDEAPLFQLGATLERQKRFDEAERTFRTVLAKDPDNALALNYLGYMMADRGRNLDEAVRLIQRALSSDPHNGSYLDSLGWAYAHQKKHDAAEPLLRRAAEQQPRNSVIQDHHGDVLERLGRLDEAIQAWQRALDGDGEEIDRAAVTRKIAGARSKRAPR